MTKILLGVIAALLLALSAGSLYLKSTLNSLQVEQVRSAVLTETNASMNDTINDILAERELYEELSAQHQVLSAKLETELTKSKRQLENVSKSNKTLSDHLAANVDPAVVDFLLALPSSEGNGSEEVSPTETIPGADPAPRTRYTTSNGKVYYWCAEYRKRLSECNNDKDAIRRWVEERKTNG